MKRDPLRFIFSLFDNYDLKFVHLTMYSILNFFKNVSIMTLCKPLDVLFLNSNGEINSLRENFVPHKCKVSHFRFVIISDKDPLKFQNSRTM